MNVFFYGLFMDVGLLHKKGVEPSALYPGFVSDFQLQIGERATLVPCRGSRAYGVVVEIPGKQVSALYAEPSVADYVPERVIVERVDGVQADATCYNLPAEKILGTNTAYALELLEVATQLGFPDAYLDLIRQAATQQA